MVAMAGVLEEYAVRSVALIRAAHFSENVLIPVVIEIGERDTRTAGVFRRPCTERFLLQSRRQLPRLLQHIKPGLLRSKLSVVKRDPLLIFVEARFFHLPQ